MALEEAKHSVAEDDRVHPKVGVVIVKDGEILSTAHRGEFLEGHAEYIALEKKLAEAAVAGATVYTTLEPCTTRSHPIPCVERLIERKTILWPQWKRHPLASAPAGSTVARAIDVA